MAQITKKTTAGADAGTVELDDAMFAIQPNVPVLHQVVTAQLAARRAGTQSTKTRSEVRGGGGKPYRQKGTGNARQGSIRAPQFSGGGIALGPKPRSYAKRTPKKMISLALRSALSDRAQAGKVVVVDEWGWDAPSTKQATAALARLGVDGKVLVVVGRDDAAVALSFRNLPEVQLIAPGELNAYDVLCNDWIVFSEAVLPEAPAARERGTAATRVVEAASSAAGAVADAAETVVDGAAAAVGAVAQGVADTAQAVADAVDDEADVEFAPADFAGAVLADAEGNGPASHPIKGNADSMLYHVPGSSHYERTVAEVWFDTEASAEAAGFQKPKSQRTAAATPAGDEPATDDEKDAE